MNSLNFHFSTRTRHGTFMSALTGSSCLHCSPNHRKETCGLEFTLELRGIWFSTEVTVGDVVRAIVPCWVPPACTSSATQGVIVTRDDASTATEHTDIPQAAVAAADASAIASVDGYVDPAGPASPGVSRVTPRRCVITSEVGLLVLQPDTLVSPTRIAASFDCLRRAVLSDRFRSRDGASVHHPACPPACLSGWAAMCAGDSADVVDAHGRECMHGVGAGPGEGGGVTAGILSLPDTHTHRT